MILTDFASFQLALRVFFDVQAEDNMEPLFNDLAKKLEKNGFGIQVSETGIKAIPRWTGEVNKIINKNFSHCDDKTKEQLRFVLENFVIGDDDDQTSYFVFRGSGAMEINLSHVFSILFSKVLGFHDIRKCKYETIKEANA